MFRKIISSPSQHFFPRANDLASFSPRQDFLSLSRDICADLDESVLCAYKLALVLRTGKVTRERLFFLTLFMVGFERVYIYVTSETHPILVLVLLGTTSRPLIPRSTQSLLLVDHASHPAPHPPLRRHCASIDGSGPSNNRLSWYVDRFPLHLLSFPSLLPSLIL